MWIAPNGSLNTFNVLDAGYANIDTLFSIAPWVFMFLAPAITMRSYSEEKRNGTIELLLTRPISDWQIILAKYFACFVLVLGAVLPTLIYYFSVHKLGSPTGNIDTGGMWGSYIGLVFLAAAFVAIGVFSSCLTENQIIAFIVSAILCFFCYIGFEAISSLNFLGPIDTLILKLGINEHYLSLSRGVVDTRDIMYFLSLIGVFLLLNKTALNSRKW